MSDTPTPRNNRFGRNNPEIEARRKENARKAASRPMTSEAKEKLKAALKAKWASGTRKPMPEGLQERRIAAVRKTYASGNFKRPSKEVIFARSSKGGKTMTPLKMAKCREIGLAKRGVPNLGRGAASEVNSRAHQWIIRSPEGVAHEFINLAHWARNNEHLFLPDPRPESRTKMWVRIIHGIGALFDGQGKSCSYRGWTAVSRVELVNGGGDLLGRDEALPPAFE